MSELVRKTVELPETTPKSNGKIAKSRKQRAAAPIIDETIDLNGVETNGDTDLIDVAIVAADHSLVGAIDAYKARYTENLIRFGRYIGETQAKTARALIRQIEGDLDLNEGED